jgi:hypothetical protein
MTNFPEHFERQYQKNAIGYPGPPTEARHDLTGTAVSRR